MATTLIMIGRTAREDSLLAVFSVALGLAVLFTPTVYASEAKEASSRILIPACPKAAYSNKPELSRWIGMAQAFRCKD